MLHPERIPHNEAEGAALEKLFGEHEGEPAHFTRRDPGDSGPLIVEIGDNSWEISEDGKRKKVS